MKRVFLLLLVIVFSWMMLTNCGGEKQLVEAKRETILDRIVHIEEELILEIPQVPRWCDKLDLRKRRVNIGDCELYVEEGGDGTPMVLLHGGPGATHHYFHPYFSQAKDFAKVIYYDQRGCGLSDYEKGEGYTVGQAADDLENLRKALNIDRWIVLGHSYGGLLAQYYATKYPESLAGLVLVGSSLAMSVPLKPTRQHDYISEEEKKRMREIKTKIGELQKQGKLSGESAMELLVFNLQINGDWKRQHYYKPSKEEIAQAALYEWKHDDNFNSRMSEDSQKFDLGGAFEGCPIHTIIMEGKWDLTWNTDKPEKIHKNHPGSKLVMFEQSGHSLFTDEPEKFFRELREFVENLPKVSASEICRWKEYLVEWEKEKCEKKKQDSFLVGEMSEREVEAIKEFKKIRKKIQEGEKFEDNSTTIRSFLTFLSAVHFHDVEAVNRNEALDFSKLGIKLTEEILEGFDREFSQLDIFRAPPPP